MRKVSASMTLIFIISFPLVTAVFALVADRSAHATARNEADRMATYLAGALPEPLWELNGVTITSLGETLVRQGALAYLRVVDIQTGQAFTFGTARAGSESRETDLTRGGVRIGIASFSIDYKSYGDEVRRMVTIILVAGAFVFLVLLVVIRVVTVRELARPLEGIARALEGFEAGADLPAVPPRLHYAEFLPLIDQIGTMGGTINAQMAELRELNADLGRRVAERTRELEGSNEELKAERDRVAHYLAIADGASRAKSEFLATMSHELRTPLNAVLGFSQLIATKRGLDEDTRRKAELVNESGKHLLSIINDILDVSRIEARKFELVPTVFSLEEALRLVAAMLGPRAEEKGLAFEYRLEGGAIGLVRGDERRIKQILINLAGNAVKFTARGSVRIVASYREGRLAYRVSDSGPGIPRDRLEGLFRPFERVRTGADYVEGAGLGLAISKSLALVMGGDIAVESVLGEGSTFTLDLPLPLEAATGRQVPGVARDGGPFNPSGYEGARRRILVVDDNPYNSSFFISLLSPLGFLVSTVSDGISAVQAARTGSFDLILLDYRMPGIDGAATAAALRSLVGGRDRPPIVGISASLGGAEGEGAFAEACDDYLRKPVEGAELLAVIGRHLGLAWTGLAETPSALPVLRDAPREGGEALPGREEARAIIDAVRRGDYRAVEASLAVLEGRGWASAPLARRMAERYDEPGLLRLFGPLDTGDAP